MDSIRITSGEYRGRKIESPNSSLTHPMGSRERLALFNMIGEKIKGAEVLDAYAGSGALGFEALSRGAKSVSFIEKNPKIAKVIAENRQVLGISGAEDINITSVDRYSTNKLFDIIVADPPYDGFRLKDIVCLVRFLREDGVFILSHPGSVGLISGLELIKTRGYARAHISIYRK